MTAGLLFAGVLIVTYLIGSIPFGLLLVKLRTGQDIRTIESGRTGGTNAMRAAGYPIGVATMLLDILKGASAVWIARLILPGNPWLEVLAPTMAVLGHNYSIFLMERNSRGQWRLRGGAGGAPSTGGALGLWFPIILVITPVGAIMFFLVGYASLATLSVPVVAIITFAVRAWLGLNSWEYIFYGVFTGALLMIALLPNIRRLLNGTERIVGLRARRTKETSKKSQRRISNQQAHSSSSSSSSS